MRTQRDGSKEGKWFYNFALSATVQIMGKTQRMFSIVALLLLLFAREAVGQQRAIYFTNVGPGFSVPFRDTYGCLLDGTWKADLLVGASPSAVLDLVARPTPFATSNGCGTGLIDGGVIVVPDSDVTQSDGTVYAKIRMWTGADSYAAAQQMGAPLGETQPITVRTSANGTVYLANLQTPVFGPITPWFMTEIFTTDYFYCPHPVIVPSGHDVKFVVVKPILAYRAPLNFQWQRMNSASQWLDIAGANTNFLHLTSIGPKDAGEYRAIFNFGCACEDQIAEAGVTVIGMDGSKGLTINGPAGGEYRVDYTELLGARAWLTLTNIVPSTGAISGIDPLFPSSSQRFYRVVYAP